MALTDNRNDRRRAETRRRLIEAARILFAERGPDVVAINEITAKADVGFGSFYNHFSSKQELADTVAELSFEEMGALIDRATSDAVDPAATLAAGLRAVVRRVHEEPVWGRLILHPKMDGQDVGSPLAVRAARDLQRGVDLGQFNELPILETLIAIRGALTFTCQAVVEGVLKPESGEILADLILRMLGLPGDQASEIAKSPLHLFEAPNDAP